MMARLLCSFLSTESLEYSNAVTAGRKIDRLIRALEDVEEYHQVEQSMQVNGCVSRLMHI